MVIERDNDLIILDDGRRFAVSYTYKEYRLDAPEVKVDTVINFDGIVTDTIDNETAEAITLKILEMYE